MVTTTLHRSMFTKTVTEDTDMPVLLLCQGDNTAKDRLRAAIEARYGGSPPAIASLKITFDGRARVALGPVKAWVTSEVTAQFVFPSLLRWDFVVKPLNLPVQRGIEAYDGATFRRMQGTRTLDADTGTDIISAAQSRLWAIAALLLTPLSDFMIELTDCGADCICAYHKELRDSVEIHLRDDATVKAIAVESFNPDAGELQTLTLRPSADQAPVNGVMLPTCIEAYWDDEPYYELKPTTLVMNPPLPQALFSLDEHPA